MLASQNRFAEGCVELSTHVSLDRSTSVFYLRHRGLFSDGRTQPSCHAPSRGRISFYVLLEGELGASTGLRLPGPALVRMPEDVLEGAMGRRPCTLFISGEPHVSLVVHARAERVVAPPRELLEVLPLSKELEATARRFAEIVEDAQRSAEVPLARGQLLGSLIGEGLLLPEPERPFARGQRLGEAIGNALLLHFSRLDTAPSIVGLADLAGLSPRTADCLLKQFTGAYGLPNEGLRDLARRWRLKLATLLLSAPSQSVRRVAERVGYRNAEALANALAAEGLPTPSAYRRGDAWGEGPGTAPDDGMKS